MTDRPTLLRQFAATLDRAARGGALTNDPRRPIVIKQIDVIAGPRAGALEIHAGLDAGRLLRALSADDGASVRQFIPWSFPYSPAVYMSGRGVRVEAGWPDDLAERAIKLSDLNQRPTGSGRWLAGKNELGRVVTLGLSDHAAHWLIAGTTGSGKSVALRSMVVQLAQRGDQLILIDGKFGDGLRALDHLPQVVGPLAVDLETARSALAWAVAEMTRRYEQAVPNAPRLAVVIDEVQEFADDAAMIELIRRLAAQGRAAHVSLVLATQHPTTTALGDASTKRNLSGRIALRVADYKSSEVALGVNTPRADWLLGAGDAYAVVPGHVERCQIAYIPRADVDRALTATPALAEWPAFAAEQLPGPAAFTGAELALSAIAAYENAGRPALVTALETAGLARPGGDRARRLLALGRELLAALRGQQFDLSPTGKID